MRLEGINATITIMQKTLLVAAILMAAAHLVCIQAKGNDLHSDANHPDTLAEITTMPYGMTTLPVINRKAYRYLRYKAAPHSHCSLAELQFYSADSSRADTASRSRHSCRRGTMY